MKIKDLFLPGAALGAIIYATVSIAQTAPSRTLTDPPQSPPRSRFAHTIAASGLTEPSSENISIGSPIAGLVEKVHVVAGQRVSENAPLFVIDHRHLLAQKKVAKAKIAQAQAAKKTTDVLLEQARRRLAAAQALTDSRAIAAEETADRASESLRLEAELATALASIQLAQAELDTIQTEIDRSTVRAPLAGTVLQVRIRQGEYVDGSGSPPRLILGTTDALHVRTDIDEFEIPRLLDRPAAQASPRGNAAVSYELEFVRYEPFVIPKTSLTGDSSERVDTRVLQAIYQIKSPDATIFTGQQMDVFLDAKPRQSTPQ